jgi:hypothetical protein
MRRVVAVAALVLLGPFALTACGGGGSTSSSRTATLTPVAYVKSAARKTAGQTSEHVAVRGSVSANGQGLTVSGDGDFAQHSGSMHVDFNAAGLGGAIDAVLDGTDLYLKSPLFTAALPQGKSWLKLDLSKATNAGGVDLSTLVAQDPAQTLARLRSISNVTEVGTEQLGGVDTTHYRGRTARTGVAPAGVYDLWIGKDDGYIHRVKIASVPGPKQRLETTVDFSNFGADVNVAVPPASETFDATNLKIPGLGG